MEAVELRIEIEGDFPEFLVIGRGFGGKTSKNTSQFVKEPIYYH
jgi:hypothetical protein